MLGSENGGRRMGPGGLTMDLEREFEVDRSRDEVIDLLGREETLLALLGDGTELVSRSGDRVKTATHYRALGREGVAKFEFSYLLDGDVRFEKECDGNVWKALSGTVHVEEISASECSVTFRMTGKTKALVPEFTIKAPMEDQIREMADRLLDLIEDAE